MTDLKPFQLPAFDKIMPTTSMPLHTLDCIQLPFLFIVELDDDDSHAMSKAAVLCQAEKSSLAGSESILISMR